MSGLRPEHFEIEEFTSYWNVDQEKFKAKIEDYANILIAGFPPMGNVIPYVLKNAPCRVILYHQHTRTSEETR